MFCCVFFATFSVVATVMSEECARRCARADEGSAAWHKRGVCFSESMNTNDRNGRTTQFSSQMVEESNYANYPFCTGYIEMVVSLVLSNQSHPDFTGMEAIRSSLLPAKLMGWQCYR